MPTPLEAALQAMVGRIRVRHMLRAAVAGVMAGAATVLIVRAAGAPPTTTWLVWPLVMSSVALLRFAWQRHERTPSAAAAAFERAEPSLKNIVITAQELLMKSDAAAPYMRARVLTEAGRRAASIDLRQVAPFGRDLRLGLVAVMALAVAFVSPVPTETRDRQISRFPNSQISKSTDAFTVDLLPPYYTGRPRVRLSNPGSIDAIAGTQAFISLAGGAKGEVRLNGTLIQGGGRDGLVEAVLVASGYLAIDAGPLHRLVPLTVTPDRVPDVRITAPAKDIRLATAAVSIPIEAQASDDLALRSFELRYTVVSGAGEQFSFTEGTLPARLTRASDQSWRIEAALSPAQLKLEPGDALVYRAVAADRRPGEAGAASSDTFFVEIAGPGDVALAGVEMPPDTERYALSEAMIVLKIERLQAREKTLTRPALVEAAAVLAAEQRAVRANFIFLLGGEVEDEDVEAEASSEIAEGRFANKARQEIVAATVLMGRVERGLAAASTKDALPLARDAVRALQRAFGHSRYLLRALPARTRIDPARRLSGDLASASDWTRTLAPAASDPSAEAARSAMIDLLAVARGLDDPGARADAGTRLARLAERILAMSPGAADLRAAARDVVTARDALAGGQTAPARAALQRAAAPLVARAQRGRIDGRGVQRDAARLAGAAAGHGEGRPKS